MKLIVCLDDRLGMTFNKRRQSSDSAVSRDIAHMCGGAGIAMDPRSAKLFRDIPANILPMEDPSAEYLFIEFMLPGNAAAKADELIIYRWNRHYASDMKSDIDMAPWSLSQTLEFPGTSHETITKEVYTRG